MKQNFTKSLYNIIIVSLSVISGIYAQSKDFGEITYSHAINISGKQRMLSQRMTKIYLQRLSGKTEKLNKQYQESLVEFNENFALLEKSAINSSAEVKNAVAAEKKQWEIFLQTFMFRKKLTMEQVVTKATTLLKICNDLVLEIEKEAKSKNKSAESNSLKVETVNKSGKQRMLSQRFAMLYMACDIESRNSGTSTFCQKTKDIFNKILANRDALASNKLNTAEISTHLSDIQLMLNSLDKKALNDNTIDINKISEFSNKLTATYNTVTGKYAKL